MSKFLVTGGAGFIGSHIVDALVSDGHDVVVLDNLSSGYKANLSNAWGKIAFFEGDIRDSDICQHVADGCDGIFHEAALVSVPDSINRPRDNHDINITGTLNILEAARAKRVRRVVFASSAAIYGDNPELPKREEMPPEPKSPYAMAKLAGEYYLKVYAECYGLETVALRYFNVFGPRQDPSSMYSGVISVFAQRVGQGLPITIFGDGGQTRDFVNVKDVVKANLLSMGTSVRSLNAASPASSFFVLNVAAGQQHMLLDLVSILETIVGKKVELRFEPSRAGDIQHSLANIERIRSIGFSPSVDFITGLSDLVTSMPC